MKVIYSPVAQKKISRFSRKDKVKVMKGVRKIAANPRVGKKLRGKLKGLWTVRAWPYRIIYRLSEKILMIVTVEHRQKAY